MAAKKGSKKSRGARKGGGKAAKKSASKSKSRGGAKKSTKKAAKKSTKKGGKKAAKKGTKKAAAKKTTSKKRGTKKRSRKSPAAVAPPPPHAVPASATIAVASPASRWNVIPLNWLGPIPKGTALRRAADILRPTDSSARHPPPIYCQPSPYAEIPRPRRDSFGLRGAGCRPGG